MRKILILLSFVITCNFITKAEIDQDLKDILGGVLGKSSDNNSSLSGLGTIINNVLTSSNLSLADLQGSWAYQEPAVEFKSDNLLQKAGGAAASTAIVNKIKPYYEKAGINNLKFTADSVGNFTFSTGKISVSGSISKTEEAGVFQFQFKAVGKINLGKITTYVSKSATGQLKLTFDASKLISLVNGIAQISNNSTMQSAASLLNSYDGLTVGFVLKKE